MKAVVLETRGKKAAILAKDGTVRITRGRYDVGEIIDLKPAAGQPLRRWVAAAAAAATLLAVGAGVWVDRNYVACAEVSLDGDYSIVYTLNKRDRVLEVRAANARAQAVVEALEQADIRFAPLADAVEQTMALLEDEGGLDRDEDDYVLVNVSADDDARQARLTGEVEAAMARTLEKDATLEYRIDHSDRQTARAASDSGMSAGRYALWQQSGEDEAGDDNRQAFAEAPIRELIDPPQGDAPDSDGKPQGKPSDQPATPADSGNTVAPNADRPEAVAPDVPAQETPKRQEESAPQGDAPQKGQDDRPAEDGPEPKDAESKIESDNSQPRQAAPERDNNAPEDRGEPSHTRKQSGNKSKGDSDGNRREGGSGGKGKF